MSLFLYRTEPAAFWASWADCPHDLGETPRTHRGPLVEVGRRRPQFSTQRCPRGSLDFDWGHGFHSTVLDRGVKRSPASRLATGRRGWQHEVSSRVEQSFREVHVFLLLPESGRVLSEWHGQWCGLLGVPAAFSPTYSRYSSAFSCCNAFPSPSHDASAGVTVHLMHLATTAQLALVLDFWGAILAQAILAQDGIACACPSVCSFVFTFCILCQPCTFMPSRGWNDARTQCPSSRGRSRTSFATRESTSHQSSEFGSRVGGTRTRGIDGEDRDSSSFAASQGSHTNTRPPSSVDSGCSEGGSEDQNRPSRESIGSLAGLLWTGDRRG